LSGAWDGLLPVDKPAGPTSHDVVARVRAATRVRRVGHTGTLDPAATGLLLILLGQATRLARFIPGAPKTYRGELVLGLTTTTDDLAGEIVRQHPGAPPSSGSVRAAAAARVGRQSQVPPSYSARHVDGTRLYRFARRGVAVEAPAADVTILRFDVAPTDVPDRWTYELIASAGTYVRAAVRDLGADLGCGAAVGTLRRTAIGPFGVGDALSLPVGQSELPEAARARLIPMDEIPLDLPSMELASPADVLGFGAGRILAPAEPVTGESALTAVRDDRGRLLGVGLRGPGSLRPTVVLPRGI